MVNFSVLLFQKFTFNLKILTLEGDDAIRKYTLSEEKSNMVA